MPNHITFNLNKSILQAEIINGEEFKEENHIRLTIPVEIAFKKEELEYLQSYIRNNRIFENIKIKIPAYFDFQEIFTDKLSAEAKILISINEKEKQGNSVLMEFS